MKKKRWAFFLAIMSLLSYAKNEKEEKKVIYEYKKYEKFDFDDMSFEAQETGPGSISITPRKENEFVNKIPEKKNFNREILNSLESIK